MWLSTSCKEAQVQAVQKAVTALVRRAAQGALRQEAPAEDLQDPIKAPLLKKALTKRARNLTPSPKPKPLRPWSRCVAARL